ncbi:MAG: histidine phosphatase family protein [Acholeplasmataceae bacterium]|nr:histidine phosphatase family protein [Acholeplasmataceae bacterium]
MILAMVRHGQTSYNADGLVQGRINIPLNETGKSQAKLLGETLRAQNESFDLIAASPLSRALETAFIISKQLKMNRPIYVDHQFVERDFYHLDGTPVETAMPFVRIENYRFEGYEHDQMMISRISKAVKNLRKIHGDQKILLVAHSHVIKALLRYIDPSLYTFADLIRHADIVYFEITDKTIKVLKK